MSITLKSIYRWSRFALILSIIVFALCALVAILAPPTYMGLYDTATYQARIVLFVIPIAAIICAASGLPLVRRQKTEQSNRMTEIMQRLAPDEREYLQEKLDEKLVGLNDEGEIVALDDLLDDQDTTATTTS